MLEVVQNDKKKTTTAIIANSEKDAICHVLKRLGVQYDVGSTPDGDVCINFCGIDMVSAFKLNALKMSGKYTGTVRCNEADTYDERVGTDEAVKKAMRNHKNGFRRAIIRWQSAVIKVVYDISPDSFKEALHSVVKCDCGK